MKISHSFFLLLGTLNIALFAGPTNNEQPHKQKDVTSSAKLFSAGSLSKIGMAGAGVGTICSLYLHYMEEDQKKKHLLCHIFQINFALTFAAGMVAIANYHINKIENIVEGMKSKEKN